MCVNRDKVCLVKLKPKRLKLYLLYIILTVPKFYFFVSHYPYTLHYYKMDHPSFFRYLLFYPSQDPKATKPVRQSWFLGDIANLQTHLSLVPRLLQTNIHETTLLPGQRKYPLLVLWERVIIGKHIIHHSSQINPFFSLYYNHTP